MCGTGPGGYGTLTAAATTTITYALPFSAGHEEALTQVEVSMKETIDTTTTEALMYAEVFLVRFGGVTRLLLDRGVVVGGFGQRNFVGMIGRVGYSDGDYLAIVLNNFSAVTVTYNITTAYETWLSSEDAYKGNCQGFTRLAKKTRVFHQVSRTSTQANAGGGKMLIDISFATGQAAILRSAYTANSGTNTLNNLILDEDNNTVCYLGGAASAAGTSNSYPSVGTVTDATGNKMNSTDLLISPAQVISMQQTGAGAQNDTLRVYLNLELFGNYTTPTWSKARSTNQADVTIAATTISDVNQYHAVVIDG